MTSDLVSEADGLHSLLVLRADKLLGCVDGSEEETELKLIAETVMAYEAKRWPDGADVDHQGRCGCHDQHIDHSGQVRAFDALSLIGHRERFRS